MPTESCAGALSLMLLAIIFAGGCAGQMSPSSTGHQLVDGTLLSPYTDADHLFSISKPEGWTVSVGDAIVIEDPADSGTTRVTVQPLFFSGKYRAMSAENIANYLVGSAAQNYEDFDLESARETADNSMLELVASYSDRGIEKRAVYTVFVNSPYALLTGYETSRGSFSKKENVLRAIAGSYAPITPPRLGSSGAVQSQKTSSIGPLRDTLQGGTVRIRVPDTWNVQVFPGCAGLIATDTSNTARGVIFLNGLHADYQTGLPSGTTPDEYLTVYMARDFSTVSNVHILEYLNPAVPGEGVKTIRISFDNQGAPSVGVFTVGTRSIGGYYSTVDYLWGAYAPPDQADLDAPVLVEIFNSIDYSQSSLEQCRAVQRASWGIGTGRTSGSSSSGSTSREEQLKEWYEKQDREDIFMEKYEDFVLNQDRVYNPETDQVYSVDQNFYQYYDTHRDAYKQQNLVLLTDPQYTSHVPL
ncbi:MAG: hypothetical protein EHJ95_02470, partial [Methanobacteriota archaeon]